MKKVKQDLLNKSLCCVLIHQKLAISSLITLSKIFHLDGKNLFYRYKETKVM